ncbi:MAG: hypothetical protein KDD66_13180 [Bdellovibrionales bacterium]|nr:hypothetical protein [Bdellovibrionales bacterium]
MSSDCPSREEALALLTEYTHSESLIKHALAVEAAMRWYAERGGHDVERWGVTGLLHDFDYERWPDPEADGHPYMGNKILTELNYPEDMRDAIMGHAVYTGVERKTDMAKTLFACDELTGLITASVLVRPDKSIHTLTAKSVKKKMKDKAFAKGVNREDIRIGCEEIGVEVGEHIENVIASMQAVAEELGLQGTEA